MNPDPERARSFGAAVDAYEVGRPDYSAESVAWLLEGAPGRVLDLGAGSGKLTRAVLDLGRDVVAVDPDAAMLARNPAPDAHLGTAEAIPLPDSSVAAVVVGQAWHWFDPNSAGAEIARVLVSGGRLGLVWNTRDRSHPFVAAVAEAIGASPAEDMVDADEVLALAGFTPWQRRQWQRVRWMSAGEVIAMATSRSAYLIACPAEQRAVVDQLTELLVTHPHSRGRERFEYTLNVTGYRCDRLR